ncbi:hypothetical protein EV385_1081 [Krasilnikovia cinnamomea]|uniref:Uncharacterized protein n=1 Tax=Krasilnikovia cinnamomea TaxID=349313 RepID=A0A4V2G6N2_9ACTN|nr:hypothetical protein [Krasilnikovia cinnamomea]RZU49336.1 hypothetical protein EV385_1081 [Krasilnikovia cinnamomea]
MHPTQHPDSSAAEPDNGPVVTPATIQRGATNDLDTAAADLPLLDVGGYLACGCHGSQRDHTCGPLD